MARARRRRRKKGGGRGFAGLVLGLAVGLSVAGWLWLNPRQGTVPATPAEAGPQLVEDEAWALLMRIRQYPAAVVRAAGQREPFEVAHYLHELGSAFNAFYNRHIVIDPSEPGRSAARLALVEATRAVLRSGLRLLGIRALEFM